MKIKCEKCGHGNEVNLGSLVAKAGYAKMTQKQKNEKGRNLTKARLEKLSTDKK